VRWFNKEQQKHHQRHSKSRSRALRIHLVHTHY
jgi:hypothetical protein